MFNQAIKYDCVDYSSLVIHINNEHDVCFFYDISIQPAVAFQCYSWKTIMLTHDKMPASLVADNFRTS